MTMLLRKTQFGNPILRQVQKPITSEQILSEDVRDVIRSMYYTLEHKKYGVGLAAPQVGRSLPISVIATKPTPTRPDTVKQKLTIINPVITKTFGAKKPEWEGCISGTEIYAQVPRYKKIRIRWHDEEAKTHECDFEGLIAHIIQHEVDHLNGILFVDKVIDPRSYMTQSEYRKMRAKEAI